MSHVQITRWAHCQRQVAFLVHKNCSSIAPRNFIQNPLVYYYSRDCCETLDLLIYTYCGINFVAENQFFIAKIGTRNKWLCTASQSKEYSFKVQSELLTHRVNILGMEVYVLVRWNVIVRLPTEPPSFWGRGYLKRPIHIVYMCVTCVVWSVSPTLETTHLNAEGAKIKLRSVVLHD